MVDRIALKGTVTVYGDGALMKYVPDEAELMQFTDLKDKNGKEIYEGDIVKEENETGIFIYTIEWEKYDCCFFPKALNFKTGIEQSMSSIYTELEVIGNIYENPELLKQ